jgi:predicted  nucleic acid-binding Zn-ribbon protein
MATRESEKQLMKELEQAVKDMDRAREETTIAKGIYDVQQAKLSRANEEVDALAGAVASLRGGEVDWKAIIDEARKKGAPVA